MNGLTSDDYKEAIMVQDACNLSGVVHSFSKVVSRIWEEARVRGESTDWVNRHPICVLYADKILQLAGGDDFTNYQRAYKACHERSQR